MRGLAFILMIWLPLVMSAEIYKWTDENGGVHFSDTPHPGAQVIKLAPPQSYKPANTGSKLTSPNSPQELNDAGSNQQYTAIKIVKPMPEDTIRDNSGMVNVVVEVSPSLNPEDKIQVLLDGSPVGAPQTSTSLNLQGVDRGTHQVQAQVIGSDGKMIMTSAPVTFYLHHAFNGAGH